MQIPGIQIMKLIETFQGNKIYRNDGASSHGQDPHDAEGHTRVVEDDPKLAWLRPLLWILSSWGVMDSGGGSGWWGGLLGVAVGGGEGLQSPLPCLRDPHASQHSVCFVTY